MLINSEGIVLNHTRFSENDLIVRILTKKKGLVSFLIKGGQKNKKKKYLQPLMVINMSFNYSVNKNIQYIKQLELKVIPAKIIANHLKRNSVLFLCEVISRCIKEGTDEKHTYNFIEKSLSWLNSDFCSGKNFDLWFLINFTKILGVCPDYSKIQNISTYVFDPESGCFVLKNEDSLSNSWRFQSSKMLYDFLCINIEDLEKFSLSYNDSKILMENVLKYYSIHVSNFNYKKLVSVYAELL